GVIDHCMTLNGQFTAPMQYNEVKGIAKSIARWVWKRDSYCYQEFIDRQTRKSKLGAAKGGTVRSMQYQDKRCFIQYESGHMLKYAATEEARTLNGYRALLTTA
ncbi:plasmid replicase, partial [Corynebacterium diphtheriae]